MTIKTLINDLVADSSWKSLQQARSVLQSTLSRTDRIALSSFLLGSGPRQRADFEKRSIRVAMASDTSVENFSEPLALRLLERSMFGEVYLSPFGQMAQEVRDPAGGLLTHRPDLIVLAPLTTVWSRIRVEGAADAARYVDEAWSHVEALRRHFDGVILLVNAFPQESRPHGVLESSRSSGHADLCRSINLLLSERCRVTGAAFVLDAEFLLTQSSVQWTSLHKQQMMGSRPFPDELATRIAVDIAAFCAARKGFARKCLALDLDNTLWGGVVGEDGWQGVKIGGGYPSNLYVELQQEIAQLRARGVALVLISKNNEADAWEVFERRTEMVLKRSDISAYRINWNNKAENLRQLAAELNLGLDAFVVLDDNHVERTLIEQTLPEVEVCPAGDPLEMLRWLTTCCRFETLAITREDDLRAKSYAAADERNKLASSAGNLDEYLANLETVVEVGSLTNSQLARVAQLTQKTNQFNLTTRRYTDHDLKSRMDDPTWHVFWCACRDRFADEGIIGVAIAIEDAEGWRLDSYLMSCRVLGRGVEKAFLQFVLDEATNAGARHITGEFLRTPKNGQTEGFFGACGFTRVDGSADSSLWSMMLPSDATLTPTSITVKIVNQPMQLVATH